MQVAIELKFFRLKGNTAELTGQGVLAFVELSW